MCHFNAKVPNRKAHRPIYEDGPTPHPNPTPDKTWHKHKIGTRCNKNFRTNSRTRIEATSRFRPRTSPMRVRRKAYLSDGTIGEGFWRRLYLRDTKVTGDGGRPVGSQRCWGVSLERGPRIAESPPEPWTRSERWGPRGALRLSP